MTTAGEFANSRNINNLIDHSGIIAVDIDPPNDLTSDEQFTFGEQAKDILIQDNYVMAMHYTASYRGIVVYFAIPYYIDVSPSKVNDINGIYYRSIADYILQEYNLVVDEAPKSTASLRFYSADKELYVNDNSNIYKADFSKVDIIHLSKEEGTSVSTQNDVTTGTSILALERLAQQLVVNEIDITRTYALWIKVAYGIVTSFGESGRTAFHSISSIYYAYNKNQCDRLYNKALRTANGKLTVGTVFQMAFDKGITYKHEDRFQGKKTNTSKGT